MDKKLSPLVTAIAAAAIVAFATQALGKVGGWLLLALVIGSLILAIKGQSTLT